MLHGKLKDYRVLLTFPSLTEALGAERILERFGCPLHPFRPREVCVPAVTHLYVYRWNAKKSWRTLSMTVLCFGFIKP